MVFIELWRKIKNKKISRLFGMKSKRNLFCCASDPNNILSYHWHGQILKFEILKTRINILYLVFIQIFRLPNLEYHRVSLVLNLVSFQKPLSELSSNEFPRCSLSLHTYLHTNLVISSLKYHRVGFELWILTGQSSKLKELERISQIWFIF